MKKELYVIQALNYVSFYNQLDRAVLDKFPIKMSWNLKRAIDKMRPDVAAFEEFRDKELKAIQNVYFDDEHSEEFVDTDGKEKQETGRKVKDKYVDEYKAKIDALNRKLEPIFMEKNTYEYNGYNMDEFVDSLPEDTDINFEVIEKINAILGEE